ncbi:sugar transferase, partial [Campylobacter upsaliensis]|nr:sugar transferase [Campylobacter upsaliensis]
MITNPNSAIQRIKNHLSYKLGQELIKYNTGGGVISLLFKLYHIKKTHHKLTQFRKTLELARADLAYPPLRQCFDFNEALWVKTWLTYRLGRVLLECDRDKLKGGYFKFFSKIKQAKKEFKALKESKVYRLKDKFKFKNEEDFDLFIKNYALIENLLTHYEALNEVIVLNMAFVLEHFDE